MRMSFSFFRSSSFALLCLLIGACGGGTVASSSSGGGGNGAGGAFSVTGGPNGGGIGGLNLPVSLVFSKDISPASVNAVTVQVVTILDPAGQATALPGIVASVTYSVTGNLLRLTPSVTFEPSKVSYGFVANALYEIAFSDPSNGASVTSSTGQSMANPEATFFFRTPSKGFDLNPGYPAVRAFFVDDPSSVSLPAVILDINGDGSLLLEVLSYYENEVEVVALSSPLEVPSAPVRDILFIFNDAVIPNTVLNPIDDSSPAIVVSINAASLPTYLPKAIPAEYSFTHQQADLSIIRWHPAATAFPPASFLFVEVAPTVQDLACNTKAGQSEVGVPDLLATIRVSDDPDLAVYTLTEPFDDDSNEDQNNTSAAWASDFPGLLGPVLGGGTGAEGPLLIDSNITVSDPGQTVVPIGSVIDVPGKRLLLPTVEAVAEGVFEPRIYNLSSFLLPAGWTLGVLFDRNGDGVFDPDEYLVQSIGHPLDGMGAPLTIRCAGNLQLLGIVDVRGADAPTLVRPESTFDALYSGYMGQGAPSLAALQAGGSGGRGGDVLLLGSGGLNPIPLKSPSAVPAYQSSDGKLTGASGRSSLLTATTLHDSNANFFAIDNVHGTGDPALVSLVNAGEILLQPNLGVGSSLLGNSGTANQSIDENHPTFVVESVSTVSGQTTFTVRSAPGDPTLTQASKNIGMSAIAAAGDCYLVGRLRGGNGGDTTPMDRGGVGAEPFVVVNEGALGVSTTGGGGGGGGSIREGSTGESDGPPSDPLVNQRGLSGGVALDDSAGANGGLGTIEGLGKIINSSQLDVVSQTGGRPLAELAGGELVGSLILPNVLNDGWLFEIVAFDGFTITVEHIQIDAIDVGLTDDPGLIPGSDYAFRIVPSLEIGGAGGGGSGVCVTGTVNNVATVLPTLAPGAAGGTGGGSVLLETARDLLVGPTGGVLADGGKGGLVFDVQTKFAGGGGGGGGNAVIRAGRSLQVFQGGRISVEGGLGGSQSGFGRGGSGGSGYIRIESFEDDIAPSSLANVTFPSVDESNMGRLIGLPQGVAQSLFYEASTLNPAWQGVHVSYFADTNADDILESLAWSFDGTGSDGGTEKYIDPPFRIRFNTAPFSDAGFIDETLVNSEFYSPADLVSARTGLAWNSAANVLLFCVGEGCTQIDRLDPISLLPVSTGVPNVLLPVIPSVGSSKLNVLSMAVDASRSEVFLLERATRKVHVIDANTAEFKRTITLPRDLQGAMTYLPDPLDLLIFADNANDRLVTFLPRNSAAPNPATTDYSPLVPVSQFDVSRDGVLVDMELVGMAYDEISQRLWCSDSIAGSVFELNFAAGFEGTSLIGSERFSALTFGGDGALPSAIAFRSGSLFLVHATDPLDSRIQSLPPTSVSLIGEDLALTAFGVVLPESPRAIGAGDVFIRFRASIDGAHDADGVSFRTVRIDSIDMRYVNDSF